MTTFVAPWSIIRHFVDNNLFHSGRKYQQQQSCPVNYSLNLRINLKSLLKLTLLGISNADAVLLTAVQALVLLPQ